MLTRVAVHHDPLMRGFRYVVCVPLHFSCVPSFQSYFKHASSRRFAPGRLGPSASHLTVILVSSSAASLSRSVFQSHACLLLALAHPFSRSHAWNCVPWGFRIGSAEVPACDYVDARKRGKQIIPLIAEVFGGLSPHAARFLRQLSRVAAKHTSRDSTKYGRLARSFSEHHGQRISHAIVMTDALNICDGIGKLKKRLLTQRRAA